MNSNPIPYPSRGVLGFAELGAEGFKWLQVAGGRGGLKPERWHAEKALTASDAARNLRAVLEGYRGINAPAIGCLPRPVVRLRILDLPSTDPEEVADMVDLQSGKQIPHDRDEIVVGHRVLGSRREGYTRVLLAVVHRAHLRERYAALEEAGLDVAFCGVGSEGLLVWFTHAAPSVGWQRGGTLLVDVDLGHCEVMVWTDGHLAMSRSILIGAASLQEDYPTWKDKLTHELRGSIEAFQSEALGSRPDRLVLSGAGPGIPGLAEDLGTETGLPVQTADAWQALGGPPPGIGAAAAEGFSPTPLIGLALAGAHVRMRFVPEFVRLRKELLWKSRALARCATLSATLTILGTGWVAAEARLKTATRDELHRRTTETRSAVQAIEKMKGEIEVVRSRREYHALTLALLMELQQRTPESVAIERVEIDEDRQSLDLEGVTDDRRHVRTLVAQLEQSPRLRDVQPRSEKMVGTQVRFELSCRLENP